MKQNKTKETLKAGNLFEGVVMEINGTKWNARSIRNVTVKKMTSTEDKCGIERVCFANPFYFKEDKDKSINIGKSGDSLRRFLLV